MERTVFIENEAFGTDADPDVLVGNICSITDRIIADVNLAALDLAFKYIDRRCAQELRDEQVDRVVIDILRLADLLDITVLHDDDHVGDAHGLFLVMCDEDRGDAGLLLDTADLLTSLQTEAGVEVRQRLIEKKDARNFDKSAGDGDTLLLTAGELARLAVHEVVDLNKLGSLQGLVIHDLSGELLVTFEILERERNILADCQVRVQRVVLEDQTNTAVFRGQIRDIRLTEPDLAACRLDKTADEVERRALSAAGRTEESDQLPIRDLKVEITYSSDFPTDFFVAIGILLCQIL